MCGSTAADDILIHARSADILAHLVDDQQVDRIDRNPRKQSFGFSQQLILGLFNVSGRYGLYDLGLVPLIFHQGHPESNRSSFQNFPGHRLKYGVMTLPDDDVVIKIGAFLFAQSDGHYLHQSAFEFAFKVRVQLYPVDHHNMVGF